MAGVNIENYVSYNEDTGKLYKKESFPKSKKSCKEIVSKSPKGYVKFQLFGKCYLAHRVIWYLLYNVWPTDQLDHIDGNKSNNRKDNLREASQSQNNQNRKKYLSSSIYKGVSKSKSKIAPWKATITLNKKQMHLGYFETEQAAHEAYCDAAKKLFLDYFRES